MYLCINRQQQNEITSETVQSIELNMSHLHSIHSQYILYMKQLANSERKAEQLNNYHFDISFNIIKRKKREFFFFSNGNKKGSETQSEKKSKKTEEK